MNAEDLRTCKKVVGVKQVMRCVAANKAKCVFIADDADKRVVAPLTEMCSSAGMEIFSVPTMVELGKACSIDVGAAAVAVIKQIC